MEEKENPFLEDFTGHVKRSFREVKNLDGSDVFIPKGILRKEVSLVIYHYDFLFELSNGAMRLLHYIFNNQKRNTDIIALNINSCGGFTTPTYYRCLRELKDRMVIIESIEKGIYFTNVNLFFKGSIMKCYPDLDDIILRNKWKKEEAEQ
jgi:hypothetical protein